MRPKSSQSIWWLVMLFVLSACRDEEKSTQDCSEEDLCTQGSSLCCGIGIFGMWNSVVDPPLRCTCPPPVTPTLPTIPDTECQIDPAEWGIQTNGTNAAATTDGINSAIADAVAKGCGRVKLPAGTYLIGKEIDSATLKGINLQSNMALVLDPNAVLQVVSSDKPYYCVADIDGVHDVEVTGGEIRGDRTTHDYTESSVPGSATHEFGHLVCIRGGYSPQNSDLVYIHDITLHDATGDGICIEAHGEGGSNTNITITNTKIYENRRQGISIVGGTRVLIADNEIHHIHGTAPQFGIDIESENHSSRDIAIRNNYFHDNAGGDFVKCDGNNVLFEGNTCEQGALSFQTDAPVVFWRKGDVSIRNNTVSVTVDTSNSRIGIIEYALYTKGTGIPTVIEGNTLNGGGIYCKDDAHVVVANNQVNNHFISMENLRDLLLTGNSITGTRSAHTYFLENVTGRASGNIKNGNPVEFPLDANQPYSN